MKKFTGMLVLVGASAMSMNASAENEGNAWTDCGIGGLIGGAAFAKGSSGANVKSVIINIIWALGTTAVTS